MMDTETLPHRYVVRVSSAKMPASCRGRYVHVAVMEMAAGAADPAMISTRARGCIRLVRVWSRCNMAGPRSAGAKATREAETLAAELTADDGRSYGRFRAPGRRTLYVYGTEAETRQYGKTLDGAYRSDWPMSDRSPVILRALAAQSVTALWGAV